MLDRENCTVYQNSFIKDFRIVASDKFKKEDIILLDNKVISFAYNMYQGIPILPFYDDQQDTELRDIVPFLKSLSSKRVNLKDALKERYLYYRFNNLVFRNAAEVTK